MPSSSSRPATATASSRAVLPPDGMRMPIEFGLSWSPKTGVVFHGGATLEVELPIDLDLTILKIPVDLPVARLRVSSRQASEGHARRGRDGRARASDRCSRRWSRWASRSRRHSPPRAATSGRRARDWGSSHPRARRCSVEAGPVSGGGYILLDYDKGEYAGILHLEIAGKFSITCHRAAADEACPTGPRASRSWSWSARSSRRCSSDTASPQRRRRHRRHQPVDERARRCRTACGTARSARCCFRGSRPARAADHRRHRRDLPADPRPVRLGPMVKIGWGGGMITAHGRHRHSVPGAEDRAARTDPGGGAPGEEEADRDFASRLRRHRRRSRRRWCRSTAPSTAAASRCSPSPATSRCAPTSASGPISRSRPAASIPSCPAAGRFPEAPATLRFAR